MAEWTLELAWCLGGVGLTLLFTAALLLRKARRRRARLGAAPSAQLPAAPAAARPAGARPGTTRYPIVLAHGYLGFDKLGLAPFGTEYFRGVRRSLEDQGHRVYVARVSPAAGISRRASQLARQIEALGAPRVNIIAHSMGGLDARMAIDRFGLAERVASLTTIGTPHHGTPLADLMLALGYWSQLRQLLVWAQRHFDGLYDVSLPRMLHFNQNVPDRPDVHYGSVVGMVDPALGPRNAFLAPAHEYLLRKSGPNDGIVPATSQRWGEVLLEVEADHWAQIGWFSRFDVRVLYAQLARQLRDRDL